MPGDGEQPGPELLLLTAEAVQAAHHLQPGVAGHVIGIGRDQPQVPQQGGLHVTEQAREGRLIAGLGVGQCVPERGTDHRSSIGPAYHAPQHKPWPSPAQSHS